MTTEEGCVQLWVAANRTEGYMQNSINNFVNTLRKPIYIPIGVYLLSLILSALTTTIPLMVWNWSNDYVMAHIYIIGTLGQALMDLPAVFMFMTAQRKHRK